MDKNNRKQIIENMILIKTRINARNSENREIENIGFYHDFEFKNTGLAVSNIYIVKMNNDIDKSSKKESKNHNLSSERILYEIYDANNNMIATVDEMGIIHFDEEYIETLKDVSEEYFNMLDLENEEFMLPEELSKEDLILDEQELLEQEFEHKKGNIERNIGSKNINAYSEIATDQKPIFDNITNKQEIDPYTKATSTETIADMIPEIKQKGIVKMGVVYSDKVKGQNGRFCFIGIDKDGNIQTLDSLQNTEGTTTGQTVISINSRDGSLVEEEQVAGLVRIKGRSRTNGEEELLSVKVGPYGTLEVDYVRADMSKNKDERNMSAPIQTKNMYPTTREVREFMDKYKNTDISEELERADEQLETENNTKLRNVDDIAGNDELSIDTVIVLENGEETTIRKEAQKAKVDPEDFLNRYNSRGGKTPDDKIESIQEEYIEEYGAPSHNKDNR